MGVEAVPWAQWAAYTRRGMWMGADFQEQRYPFREVSCTHLLYDLRITALHIRQHMVQPLTQKRAPCKPCCATSQWGHGPLIAIILKSAASGGP